MYIMPQDKQQQHVNILIEHGNFLQYTIIIRNIWKGCDEQITIRAIFIADKMILMSTLHLKLTVILEKIDSVNLTLMAV